MKKLIDGKNAKSTPIDKHFFCGVCEGVADDPKKCQNCENVFCEICIKATKEKANVCPSCKKSPFKEINLSRYERIKLNEAEFNCYKCQDSFPYEERAKHLTCCKSLQGLCPAGCGTIGITTESEV